MFGRKCLSRQTIVLIDGKWITKAIDGEITDAYRNANKKPEDRSIKHLSDDLGLHGVRNHADGRLYDSKAAFRKATRRAGCYELGNDVKEVKFTRQMQGDFNARPQLKQAIEKVMGT